jgi:hypothetical protein
MEHCHYCGTSLARVGLDFRALLPPLFAAAAAEIFARAMTGAAVDFERVVEQHRQGLTTLVHFISLTKLFIVHFISLN